MEKLSRHVRETVAERVARVDRDFVPITRRSQRPVSNAVDASDDRDQQSKEKLAEWRSSGVISQLERMLESRETLYHRSMEGKVETIKFAHPFNNSVSWLALNDVCKDTGEVGAAARHRRWLRVREVLKAERE